MTAPGGYRRDIDGLRAIAVLAVVIFHAHAPWLPGGFVGVDVFFVISGFLITGILVGERLSILEFYDRRIRRIFPALFVMLAVVTVAATAVMTPLDLKRYAGSAGSTAAFLSNVFFYLRAGYFETPSMEKPLLHTWSLAVEEQFYILWPLLLIALRGRRRGVLLAATLALFAASLALSMLLTPRVPDAAFYLPFTRFWELLLGAALALGAPRLEPRWAREAAGLVGLAMLAAAFVAFNHFTPFPGSAALLPSVGAALLLMANKDGDTLAARLLSPRPLVFIGLISYSLYLWHWPLLSLGRYVAFRNLTPLETAGLVALALVLAALSWRFVEQPFRRRAKALGWRRSFALGSAAGAVILAAAGVIFLSGGLPWRSPPQVLAITRVVQENRELYVPCTPERQPRACRLRTGEPTFILWGDSQASAAAPGLREAASRAGLSGALYSIVGCPPLLEVSSSRLSTRCPDFNRAVMKALIASPKVDTVILTANWPRLAEPLAYGRYPVRKPAQLRDPDHPWPNAANNPVIFANGVERTVRTLRTARPDVRIILLGQPPETDQHTTDCLSRMAQLGRSDEPCRFVPKAQAQARLARTKAVLRQVGAQHGAEVIFLDERTCRGERCETVMGGTTLYMDTHHLTIRGSRLLLRDFPLTITRP